MLHMICGKIAAGKSTLARRLADAPATVLISEDYWLSRLYKDEQKSVADYVRNSGRLREPMGSHIADLLRPDHQLFRGAVRTGRLRDDSLSRERGVIPNAVRDL